MDAENKGRVIGFKKFINDKAWKFVLDNTDVDNINSIALRYNSMYPMRRREFRNLPDNVKALIDENPMLFKQVKVCEKTGNSGQGKVLLQTNSSSLPFNELKKMDLSGLEHVFDRGNTCYEMRIFDAKDLNFMPYPREGSTIVFVRHQYDTEEDKHEEEIAETCAAHESDSKTLDVDFLLLSRTLSDVQYIRSLRTLSCIALNKMYSVDAKYSVPEENSFHKRLLGICKELICMYVELLRLEGREHDRT